MIYIAVSCVKWEYNKAEKLCLWSGNFNLFFMYYKPRLDETVDTEFCSYKGSTIFKDYIALSPKNLKVCNKLLKRRMAKLSRHPASSQLSTHYNSY